MQNTDEEWCFDRFIELANRKSPPLTEEEKTHRVVYDCVFNLWNGGLDSLYENSTGEFAEELPRLFANAGMHQCADTMRRLNALTFKGPVPTNDQERSRIYSSFVEECSEEEILEYRSLEALLCELPQGQEELFKSLVTYARRAL